MRRVETTKKPRAPVWRAWGVHFYTGLGLLFALLAAVAVLQRHAFGAFAYSALAMFIDGTDGALARKWEVRTWTPMFDGRKLDDIVDYLTYTFIPVLFAHQFGIVQGGWIGALFVVLMSSAYAFCTIQAKTEEGFFTGFPSYWNVVVLYLYWFDWPTWTAGAILLGFSALAFVPLKYISLSQTRRWRNANVALFVVWVGALLGLAANFEEPSRALLWASLFYPAYYLLGSFVLNVRKLAE